MDSWESDNEKKNTRNRTGRIQSNECFSLSFSESCDRVFYDKIA